MDKQTAQKIIAELKKAYGEPGTQLNYTNPFELLVAVILSAQCTDKRVNQITPQLFSRYGTPQALANAEIENVKEIIRPCGFFNTKAKNIISASRDIVQKFGGQVPSDFDSLLSLDGVGRKTANVLSAVAFYKQAMPVDTHVFRVARRIGLSDKNTPEKVERDLVEVLDNNTLTLSHHLLITHGRQVCKARKPQCCECVIKECCRYYEQIT